MTGRNAIILALVALIAVLAAIWISASRAPEAASAQPGPLAPGLQATLDEVTAVRITGAGNERLASLSRSDAGWGLDERHGYPVDVEPLRVLLGNLAAAQRVEAKTASPQRHAQLGVEDVSASDAHGVRVDVVTPGKTWSWIIGDNLIRGTGTYVREADADQSWQIDRNIAVERSPANWLRKDIIDIGANQIERIEVEPVSGPAFALRRVEDDPASDFAFTSLPKGRKAGEGYRREALAGVLSQLRFEDVSIPEEQPLPEKSQRTRYLLRDGRSVTLRSWEQDGHTFAMLEQTWEAPEKDTPAPSGEASEQASGDNPTAADVAAETPAATVADFQRMHAAWVYRIPSYKAGNLSRALEDYLATDE